MQPACIYLTVTRAKELCALTCALTSFATLAPLLGGAQFNGCLHEEKLYNREFPLKSTSLQKALLPLLPRRAPFCSLLPWLAPFCSLALLANLGLRLSARLPWLTPSCKKATPQQRQQVREGMTQLAVATSKQVTGMANVIFACLAAQLNIAKCRCFTESRSLCSCSSLSSTAGNSPS